MLGSESMSNVDALPIYYALQHDQTFIVILNNFHMILQSCPLLFRVVDFDDTS